MRTGICAVVGWMALIPASAQAAVIATADSGFAVESSVDINADAGAVYALLAQPARWWNGEHSFSGSAANLSLEPKAGGCFCETLPGTGGQVGSVEHARVIYAAPGKQLRLSGALGPLQAEAVIGTLNFDLSPTGRGVRVTLSYVVGGYMRVGAAKIAPIVDQVLAEQLAGLKRTAEGGKR